MSYKRTLLISTDIALEVDELLETLYEMDDNSMINFLEELLENCNEEVVRAISKKAEKIVADLDEE